jgi:hypothetical protein
MVSDSELEHVWRYVGRFMWTFAIVESYVDEIFVQLFNLNASATLMILNKLIISKKLELIELALKHQGIDHGRTLKRVRDLSNIRNAIAHSAFGPDKDGVDFDYVNQSGKLLLPGRPKPTDKDPLWDTLISYAQFDEYDSQARELWDALGKIGGSFTAVSDDISSDFATDIQEAISAPDNVIPFPVRRQSDDEGN